MISSVKFSYEDRYVMLSIVLEQCVLGYNLIFFFLPSLPQLILLRLYWYSECGYACLEAGHT